ncbi:NfeD family protein [Gammaproteobacteria bacterium]|nr:NfeD family protein [Gammaproteobacteria bacterium]
MEYLTHLTYWHWLTFGVILLVLEIISGSSGFILWMAFGAGFVGILVWIFPGLEWTVQLISFSLFSILTVIGWRLYLKKHPIETDKPTLNRRGEQYIGRIFTLDDPVINGMGKVRVDDSSWRIRCDDSPAGQKVKIIGVDGVILIAKKTYN